eukprot:623994-Rhodomonas_salina.1
MCGAGWCGVVSSAGTGGAGVGDGEERRTAFVLAFSDTAFETLAIVGDGRPQQVQGCQSKAESGNGNLQKIWDHLGPRSGQVAKREVGYVKCNVKGMQVCCGSGSEDRSRGSRHCCRSMAALQLLMIKPCVGGVFFNSRRVRVLLW